ncbi:c-type cytochrome [Pukyongiella litopenaei]|uniref:C-type cytochrome n=1 Tax=Pukyongiella litopenaei TaxID=2605946 RepID=A0A2S0ML38_9RHOB|nr:c-type cytochrome [Pukyongiella litopenaei]AVO36403.1 c-type cytochrome [Pukyongiella litopenaei]
MRAALTLILSIMAPVPLCAGDFFSLKGHGGPVMAIAVSPQDRIATASFDNAVALWDETVPHWLDGHEAAVNTVIFAGDAVISGGDDFTVRMWTSPGRVIGRHKGKVAGLAAASGLVASASWDGSIGIWPMDGGEGRLLQGHDAGVNAVAFSGDGKHLWSAGADGTLRLWDTGRGEEIQTVLRHGFGINKIVLDEAAGWLAYGAVDGVTRVIEPRTGAAIADFTLDRRPILALARSPDGTRLAVGDGQGYIMVIDTIAWQIEKDVRATLRGPVWALAFSADGENIHAGGLDSAMYSWPVATLADHDPMGRQDHSFLKPSEEMDNGERQFARKCSICHTLSGDSARRAGPTLAGLFGRPAGTVGDYAYSEALDGSQIVWDAESIDALFDLGPDHYIPGTKMPMQRITDPADRADLIAYLRRATATGD